jgi:hypothetical protein
MREVRGRRRYTDRSATADSLAAEAVARVGLTREKGCPRGNGSGQVLGRNPRHGGVGRGAAADFRGAAGTAQKGTPDLVGNGDLRGKGRPGDHAVHSARWGKGESGAQAATIEASQHSPAAAASTTPTASENEQPTAEARANPARATTAKVVASTAMSGAPHLACDVRTLSVISACYTLPYDRRRNLEHGDGIGRRNPIALSGDQDHAGANRDVDVQRPSRHSHGRRPSSDRACQEYTEQFACPGDRIRKPARLIRSVAGTSRSAHRSSEHRHERTLRAGFLSATSLVAATHASTRRLGQCESHERAVTARIRRRPRAQSDQGAAHQQATRHPRANGPRATGKR